MRYVRPGPSPEHERKRMQANGTVRVEQSRAGHGTARHGRLNRGMEKKQEEEEVK